MSSSVSRYVIDTCLSLLVRHLFVCFVGVVFVEAVGHTLCVLFRNAAGFWWRTHSVRSPDRRAPIVLGHNFIGLRVVSPLSFSLGVVMTWSHAGLNRGPFGYWPNALTN